MNNIIQTIRHTARAAAVLLLALCAAQTAGAWDGEGTSNEPFQIKDASDLAELATGVNGGNKYTNIYFVQTGDITASGSMETIGTSNPFCGHYDGGGFTISGLTQPLFGSIKKGQTGATTYTLSEVKNLTISEAGISDVVTGGTTGILAKSVYNNVSVTNCHVVSSSLAITGGSNAKCGGLIGSVEDDQSSQPLATVSGCSVTATTISNSISGQYCGGLFGYLTSRKNVYDNYVEATLTADNKGGIAGYLSSTATPTDYHDNYYHAATGLTAIASQTDAGEAAVCALSGVPVGVTASPAALLTRGGKDYYAAGAVTLTVDDASKAFTSFTVSGATYSLTASLQSATVTLSTSDATVSAEMKTVTGPCGDEATWTMSDANGDGTPETLTISGTGDTYDYDASDNRAPWKTDFSPTTLVLAGDITRMAIADEADLRLLSAYVNGGNSMGSDKTFVQTADITMTGGDFEPIGKYYAGQERFCGTYDGQGHTISGLTVSGSYYQAGLFGAVMGATVRNVRLVSPSVSSSQQSAPVGTVVGYTYEAHVENCWVYSPTVSATGSGTTYVGAIIGRSGRYADVLTNLYFYDDAHDYAAVGEVNDGTVTNVARARLLTLGSGISSVSPADASSAANGFQYQGHDYYREGLQLTVTPAAELTAAAANLPEGYDLSVCANGTRTGSATAYTVSSTYGDATLTAAIRSTGQAVSIAYVLADGTAQEAQAIALDGTETTLAAGNYFVGIAEANFDHTVMLTGDATLILKDGCTMNVGTSESRISGRGIANSNKATLTIYGQSAGSGALSVYTTGGSNVAISVKAITVNGGNIIANTDGTGSDGIYANYTDLTINGGTVTAYCSGSSSRALVANANVIINGGTINATGTYSHGIYGKNGVTINGGIVNATTTGLGGYGINCGSSGTITLGWTNPTDRITASSFSGTVSVATADGHKLYDGNGNFLSGTVSDLAALNGKTLQPALSTAYITAQGTAADDPADAIVLSPDQTTLGAHNYVALGTLNYNQTVTLTGNATLILADGCQMNIGSDEDRINGVGIYGFDDANGGEYALTITSQSLGTGMGTLSIYTTGGWNYAIDANALTINGGNITADTNGDYAYTLDATTDITINGGNVRANATGEGSIAIYNAGNFTYSGGNLTATATGIDGNAIYADGLHYTFNWRTPDDRITIGASGLFAGYDSDDPATVTFTSLFTDGTDIYSGTLTGEEIAVLAGKTLQPGNSLAANKAPDGNYWTTYYNGAFGHVIPDHENACAYTATYNTTGDGGKLTLHKIGTDGKTIPADCAVIIVADNPEVSMTAATALDDYSGPTNDLRGVDDDTPLANIRSSLGEGTLYVLGMTTVDNEQHFGFHRYTGSEMAAHKAFVLVSGTATARSLTMVFDDASGIESAEADSSLFTLHSSLSTWFTLDGRRLQAKPTAPGIYINNGKKVVIK